MKVLILSAILSALLLADVFILQAEAASSTNVPDGYIELVNFHPKRTLKNMVARVMKKPEPEWSKLVSRVIKRRVPKDYVTEFDQARPEFNSDESEWANNYYQL